jgi:hypothetical protein
VRNGRKSEPVKTLIANSRGLAAERTGSSGSVVGHEFAEIRVRTKKDPEDLMNKWTQNRLILGTLALVLGGNPRLYAQQSKTPSPSTTSSQQEPGPGQPREGESSSNDAQAQPSDKDQMFIGRVVKSGNTFVLRHASGKIYDVDHPEELKQYEGQQVRVKSTLDPDGKTVHMK